jgi:hypothetical protein
VVAIDGVHHGEGLDHDGEAVVKFVHADAWN